MTVTFFGHFYRKNIYIAKNKKVYKDKHLQEPTVLDIHTQKILLTFFSGSKMPRISAKAVRDSGVTTLNDVVHKFAQKT